MMVVRGALRACTLVYKRAGGIADQMEVSRPDGSRSAYVRTYSMAPCSRLVLDVMKT